MSLAAWFVDTIMWKPLLGLGYFCSACLGSPIRNSRSGTRKWDVRRQDNRAMSVCWFHRLRTVAAMGAVDGAGGGVAAAVVVFVVVIFVAVVV